MKNRMTTVAVIGAGTMGIGIAQVVAMAGWKVQLFDTKAGLAAKSLTKIKNNLKKAVEKGKLEAAKLDAVIARITVLQSFREIKSGMVIEAVVEDLEVKEKLFKQIEDVVSPDTLVCTNTSSIPVTKIGASMTHPERLVGMHFFNPAQIMKLVEVVSTEFTNQEKLQQAITLVEKFGKTPVLTKDSPGFIVNRVARHFYVESLKVLEDGVADYPEIDTLMEASGFRMGPFKLMDLIGIDVNFSVTSTLYNGFHQDPKFRPSRVQEQKVELGQLGRKTGKGFYDYE
jgi:3-hydroxybutyryl-CoA dehydrogenase